MSITSRAIQTRLLAPDQMTEQEAVDLATIDMLVQRNIFCRSTGKILDSRTAVLVSVSHPAQGLAEEAFHPDADLSGLDNLPEPYTYRTARAADLVRKLL
jgi:hypothetical protein